MKTFNWLVCLSFALAATQNICHGQLAIGPSPYLVAGSDYSGQNGNTGGAWIGYPAAQTFTASQGGTLFSISAGFYAPQNVPQSYYIFQFRDTTAAGLPDSTIIAFANASTAPLSIMPPGGPAWIDLTADFSTFGINLVAGHKYAISVDVPGPFGVTLHNGFAWGLTGSGYSGGESYLFTASGPPIEALPGEDFLFKVYAVPEPSLILPGVLAFFCSRRLIKSSRR